jgi:hypothetical protein
MADTPQSPEVQIGADGIDAAKIVAEIKERVEERRRNGDWDDPRIARAEKHNLLNLKDDEEFLSNYLACLRQIVQVDINDFEIYERRPRFAKFFVRLKKGIWGLLRFYTYRLWSQQNQTNTVLFSAIELLSRRSADRVAALEKRVAELERQLAAASNREGE